MRCNLLRDRELLRVCLDQIGLSRRFDGSTRSVRFHPERCGHDRCSMAAKMIRLRYPSKCAHCEVALPAGTNAWWDADDRSGSCLGCHGDRLDDTDAIGPREVAAGTVSAPGPGLAGVGLAGASARQEYLHGTVALGADRTFPRR